MLYLILRMISNLLLNCVIVHLKDLRSDRQTKVTGRQNVSDCLGKKLHQTRPHCHFVLALQLTLLFASGWVAAANPPVHSGVVVVIDFGEGVVVVQWEPRRLLPTCPFAV